METYTPEQRRFKLHSLISEHFSGDNDLVAQTIRDATGKKVSERTIQAWLISPSRTSSRNCPEWVLKVLHDYIADPARGRSLRERAAARDEADAKRLAHPLGWSDRVRSQKAVEFATNEIEWDERRLRHWQSTFGVQAGKAIFDLEREMHAEHRALQATTLALHQAATEGPANFEAFIENYKEKVRANDLTQLFVREARRDIEGNADEFSTDDGISPG